MVILINRNPPRSMTCQDYLYLHLTKGVFLVSNILFRQSLINSVEKILHVPGNYTIGTALEMTIVIDCALDKNLAKEKVKEAVTILKQHSKVFSNVRTNLIFWNNDMPIHSEITSIAMLQIGNIFNTMPEAADNTNDIAELMSTLKKFHARSKLILLFMGKQYEAINSQLCTDSLKPFLSRKISFILDDIILSGDEYFNHN